ncbi:hypothetical protein EV138_1499 [Kribbella voronezhensis]|uniref:Uncharacterized protein n=1 Tax=Kribbella voronezhensis TaxID=2512212 RepID=A0A4R7T7V4_9ACTN|nr:hypothetical protein [Kribbella voronezhensis]TDU87961.1 hypothetical protein EV138_1499 [Kribbella voronezhensis]
MSSSQFTPMPFEGPEDPDNNPAPDAANDTFDPDDEPLAESGEPDEDETPAEEDPDDQLPRD